jgi:hypothetical protein
VIDMLLRGDTGIPPTPVRMLVEGRWNTGQTLRLSADAAKPVRAKARRPARPALQVARS